MAKKIKKKIEKKILNGQLYDTHTAESIGSWNNGMPYSDYEYYGEDLYQKKNGEFFLVQDGLPEWSEGSTVFGSYIVKISEAEAREWVEEHLSADKYISLFGKLEE